MFLYYHPAVLVTYFTAVITLTLIGDSSALLVANLVFACVTFILVKDNISYKTVLSFALMFVAITLINPLFNSEGTSVLFTYFNGRPYTLEALAFGVVSASKFVALLFWFASLNILLTTQKINYLFGSAFPKITMVLILVMRFIPMYTNITRETAETYAGLGCSFNKGSLIDRFKLSCNILRGICTTSIVQSIATADSMCARGYGSGKASHFVRYCFTAKDKCICVFILILGALIAANPFANITSSLAYLLLISLPAMSLLISRMSWEVSLLKT